MRNLIRIIPDITYVPVGLHPAWAGPEPLDMSDCSLRSVSPVHLQYLANMGVRASASVSIVIDGVLWGLIARHHVTPRAIPYDNLAARYPPALGFQAVGSGLLAMTVLPDRPWLILWFRAEVVETVKWAGNPHKGTSEEAALTPRGSFAAWQETVRAHSRRWSPPELDAARRLRATLLDMQQHRHMQALDRQLTEVVQEKNVLLLQKDFLIGEVNHRVQNCLPLVSSFLSIQARASDNSELQSALEEARRRLKAVSVVHRRLYRGDQIENVDAAR